MSALFERNMEGPNWDLICGFIKQLQSLSSSLSSLFTNIPKQIFFICLAYFETDYFDVCGRKMEITNNHNSMTYTDNNYCEWNNCYGNVIISSTSNGYYSWMFKIDFCCSIPSMCIGIANIPSNLEKDRYLTKGFHYSFKNVYGIKSNGERYSGNSIEYQNKDGNNGFKYKCNDKILMELDMKNQTLIYTQITENKDKKQDKFSNVKRDKDINYRVAITTYYPGDKVTLLQYKTHKTNR